MVAVRRQAISATQTWVALAAVLLSACQSDRTLLALNAAVDPALAARRESVLVGRPYAQPFVCSEHFDEPWQTIGNALGRDCYALGAVTVGAGVVASLFAGDGATNAQHFSYGAPLIAPFDGTVIEAVGAVDSNTPGVMTQGVSGHIVFRRADGVHVVYAHVKEVSVIAGTAVRQGDPVAVVAAAGVSRQPHVHIGAWKGGQPLQPQFDLISPVNPADPAPTGAAR